MAPDVVTAPDVISGALQHLSMIMPVLVIVAVIASFALAPPGRRIEVIAYVLTGIVAGILGAHGIEPIRPGGWNWQFVFYPFLFAKWFFVGFAAAWGVAALALPGQRVLACYLLVFAAIPLALTILNLTYVQRAFRDDRTYWTSVLSTTAITPEQLDGASDHLSSQGRESVRWHLHYHPDNISAPALAKLHALGFNVLHARNAPEEIRTTAIAAAQAKLANETSEWRRSQIVAPIVPLASNPTLNNGSFQLLAQIGDSQVIAALIRNKANDDSRMQWLRDTIERRVGETKHDNDSDRWYVERLREQLAHLDKWWHFKKTGNWNS